MEDFRLDLTMGANRGTRCRTINLPRFTLIGATTKLASISAPLRDRFGISQKIEYYTYDELKQILVNFARLINLDLDDEASHDLSKISRGTPRIALRLLRRVRDYAQVIKKTNKYFWINSICLLYTSPSPRDRYGSRMPSSA